MTKLSLLNNQRIENIKDCAKIVSFNKTKGLIVECGVFKGGSAIEMIKTFQKLNDERQFLLFDTFEGMPEMGKYDKKPREHITWRKDWNKASVWEVFNNIKSKCGPAPAQAFPGLIEKTLTNEVIFEEKIDEEGIALLHLDMDFYSPTKHALKMLFSYINPGGYIIIDDYGAWEGCRKACNEFFGDRMDSFTKGDWSQRILKV